MAPSASAALRPAAVSGHAIPSLKQLWVIVWAYRFWVFTLIASLMAMAALVSESEKVYRATATLLVEFSVGESGELRMISSAQADTLMATQTEFVRGSRILFLAVQQLGLAQDARYMKGYKGDDSAESRSSWAVDRLNGKLHVARASNRRLLYIAAEDADPREAARLANGVADAFVNDRARQAPGAQAELIKYFGAQLDALEAKVLDAQTALNAYRDKAGSLALPEDGQVDPALLVELERRLSGAHEDLLRVERALAAAEEGRVVDSGSELIEGLQQKLASSEKELAQLRTTLGNRHPDIVALQRVIEETRSQLQSELTDYRDRLQQERDAAAALEEKFRRELTRQRGRSSVARTSIDEQKRLESELRTTSQVYLNALDSYDRMQDRSAGPFGHSDFDARALVPQHPYGSDMQGDVLRAGSAGLLLGIAGCLIFEFMNRRIRCREDMERGLGVPVLVELPNGV